MLKVSGNNIQTLAQLQTYKGLLYITITTLMLFYLLRIYTKRKRKYLNMVENALSKAENANNLKTTFLTNLSHEIRTPMNAINGFIEIVDKHKNLDTQKVQNFNTYIKNASEKLLSIIQNIVLISKIQENQVKLNVEKVSANSLIQFLQRSFQNQVDVSKRLKIKKQVSNNFIFYTDLEKLFQILEILSLNLYERVGKGDLVLNIEENNNFLTFSFYWEQSFVVPYSVLPLNENNIDFIEFESFGVEIVKGLTKILNGNLQAFVLHDNSCYFVLSLSNILNK